MASVQNTITYFLRQWRRRLSTQPRSRRLYSTFALCVGNLAPRSIYAHSLAWQGILAGEQEDIESAHAMNLQALQHTIGSERAVAELQGTISEPCKTLGGATIPGLMLSHSDWTGRLTSTAVCF